MRDSYLEAAQVVLRARGKPLSAREILHEARKYGFLAPHLHGATMHKTLHARLSEDIVEHRFRSVFYRTSPGVFFLRELSNDPNMSSKITNEFFATRRQKSFRRQRVLCAPMQLVSGLPSPTNNVSLFLDIFESEAASYVAKKIANSSHNLAQLATFCSVILNNDILAHHVGVYASVIDYYSARPTVLGFKSYVSEFDLDLLNDDRIGLRRNACRELLRFIFLPDDSITDVELMSRMRVAGMATVGNTVACITAFDANQFPFELRGRRKPLDLNRPQWVDRTHIQELQLDPLSLAALRVLNDDSQVF